MSTTALLLTNFAATWFLVGLIWVIQVVHYPLFAGVGKDQFGAYHHQHTTLITFVVVLPMVAELASSIWLCWQRPPAAPLWLVASGAALAVLVWAITFLIAVPQHDRLSAGQDLAVISQLVTWNWLRTVAWTAHGAVTVAMLAAALRERLA